MNDRNNKKTTIYFDKNGSVKISNIDGSIEQGKIKSVNNKMVEIEKEDMKRKLSLYIELKISKK